MTGMFFLESARIIFLDACQPSSGTTQSMMPCQSILSKSLLRETQFAFLKLKIFHFGAFMKVPFVLTLKFNKKKSELQSNLPDETSTSEAPDP